MLKTLQTEKLEQVLCEFLSSGTTQNLYGKGEDHYQVGNQWHTAS